MFVSCFLFFYFQSSTHFEGDQVDKMDDVTPASVRKQFSLFAASYSKKFIFKLYNDDIECTCAGVEAQQPSISYVFSLHYTSYYST